MMNKKTKPKLAKKPRRIPNRSTKRDYVSGKELLEEVIACKAKLRENPGMEPAQAISPRLAAMFKTIVEKYGSKSNWAGYSYREEFVSDALLQLVRKWHVFDENRVDPETGKLSDNPFAFYTRIIYHCFVGYYHKEKIQAKIKSDLMERHGYAPSHGVQADRDAEHGDHGGDD